MSSPGRVVLAGQGRWARALAEGLARRAGFNAEVAAFDSGSDALSLSRWSAVRAADTLLLVGFRPGATTVRGRVFDAALALALIGRDTRVIHYWIGSDVQRALADAGAGHADRLLRTTSGREHFAGSEPLARDLATLGIDVRVVPFPWEGVPSPEQLPAMPERFTALSYVPDARPDFYGGPELVAAARALPQARFVVMGGTGAWVEDAPSNLEFTGWVADTGSLYAGASCVVRLTEYDSIGGTAVEGLAWGRPVIYNHELEHATLVPFRDATALIGALEALAGRHAAGTLEPDADASAWARLEFDPAARFSALAGALTDGATP